MALTNGKKNVGASLKHLQLEKANTTLLIWAVVASILVSLTLVSSNALIKKMNYNNKVLSARSNANKTLKDNYSSINKLITEYNLYNNAPESIMGNSEPNAQITLDALPSKYDFPANISSLSFLAAQSGVNLESVTGTDEESSSVKSELNPVPKPLKFNVTYSGSYEGIQKLVGNLYKSIRPYKIEAISITPQDAGQYNIVIALETYYQPTTDVGIQEGVVDSKTGQVKVEPSNNDQPADTGGQTL